MIVAPVAFELGWLEFAALGQSEVRGYHSQSPVVSARPRG